MEITERQEEELVARCGSGDGGAFEHLLRPHRRRLLGYLVRASGDPALAEDLLQETLLRAWKALADYRSRGRLVAWLFTIARSVVVDRVRRRDARPTLVSAPEVEPEAREDPSARLLANELAERLSSTVAELPERQRDVFLLRLDGDLKFREIAELRGEPLSTVLGHMHYAMKKLRRTVRDHHE